MSRFLTSLENMENKQDLKGGEIEKEDLNNCNSVEDNEKEGTKMSYRKGGKTYYRTKAEALGARRAGDRIYYDANEGAYYIVRPSTSGSFWGW